jgi:hypothetical protein
MKINEYLNDGASEQAQAVLAYMRPFNIEESWNEEYHCYDARIEVARWENCREQGYVVMLRSPSYEQLNIAFFEHRNSDSICAIKWEQRTLNAPTIDTADFGGTVYKGKFDVSHEVKYGQVTKMSEWIEEQLSAFWINAIPNPKTVASNTAQL